MVLLGRPEGLEPRLSEECRGRLAEGGGDAQDVEERDVPLASLNLAEVGSLNPGGIGQSFLGHALRLPFHTDGLPQLHKLTFKILFA